MKITSPGPVVAASAAAGSITNAMLAPAAAYTVKGNATSASASPTDMTPATLAGFTVPIYKNDCIGASQVTSGNADFFTTAGTLTLTLVANSTDPFVYCIGGRVYSLTANVTLSVTDNAHNFIFIDDTGAMSRQATPCAYTFTAPGSPASGDHWYDLGKQQMKKYNGSSWAAVNEVAIGYVRADATVINATYACEPIGFTPWDRWNISNGSDGFLNVTAGTTTIDTTKNYTAIVITSTANIKHTAATSSQPTLCVQGVIALMGSSGIDLQGLGRAGASGATGTPSTPLIAGFGSSGGGGGGGTNAGGAGASRNQWSAFSGSGAGGSAGGAGGGTGGAGVQNAYCTSNPPFSSGGLEGGGGGGGGGDGVSAGANGGAGGGAMVIYCAALAATSGSVLRATGVDGTVGGGANRGGGGGGGGGNIQLFCRNYLMNGTFSAAGGSGGGSGGAGSGAGGNGGAGLAARIQI